MTRKTAQILLALSLAGCCFGGRGGTPPPPGSGAPVPGGSALAPGFTPDPMLLSGSAGGLVPGSTLGMGCLGSFGVMPNHTFTLTQPFNFLRFSVTNLSGDTTIAVRSPTGQVFCNDDAHNPPNTLNPEVTGAFPAGQVQVYIGVYSGGTMPYTMEVSQTPVGSVAAVIGPSGIPTSCGMSIAAPNYGTITVGSSVVLGGHTPWTGPDGQGGYATASTNWAPEMGQYVGQRTIVTSLEGVDDAGCPVVHVAVDNGGFYWRIGSMSL